MRCQGRRRLRGPAHGAGVILHFERGLAQAEREKQARIILGQAELAIAHTFEEAARSYQHNPVALHLRAMNMLYEGLKEKGALMLIPSSAVESMGMGGLMGAAALRQANLTGGSAAPPEDKTPPQG